MSWKRPGYRAGSHLVKDDRTGFTIWSHDAVKEWNGAIVHRKHFEARHPQDTIRVRREDLRVPDARPQPIDQFIGPLMTTTVAAASAGSTALEVEHTERMQGGDHIGIFLADGDLHRNIIQTVVDLANLVLINPLPGSVASGATLVNYSAVATE